jgi:hypothetical protein
VTVKHGVMISTTGRVHMGTQPVVSLHRLNAVEGEVGMTELCVTSFAAKMHATGSKTGTRSMSALIRVT